MNNKKILSIITLAGVATMTTQSVTANIPQSSNKILLTNNKNLNTNNGNSIKDNVITINNVWNYSIGTLKFNPETSKIEFTNGWQMTNPYASKNTELFSISLYKSNGELIKSVQLNGDNYSAGQEISNAFNNLGYSYGDIIEINYNQSSKISISNFNGQKSYEVNKPISMEITKSGLKELSNNLTVNPIYFDLGSNKVDVSGKTIPNTAVNIWIDGKDYTTNSNSTGEYNLNIEADKAITESTQISVFVGGEENKVLNPMLNPENYKLNYTSISLNGYWGGNPYLVSQIGFNQYTKKLNVKNRGSVYFSWNSNSPAYTITLLNKNGGVIKSESYNGSGSSQSVYNEFNGLSFEYGDSIKITSYGLDMSLNNPNGKVDNMPGNSTKTVEYEITQEGLKETANNLTVNPIYFELGSNKIDVSGKTIPNSMVNIWIEGKDYTTTSNSQGEYNLNIEAEKDITSATKIGVFVNGEQEKVLTATVDPNIYKIVKNNITLMGNWYGSIYKAANISFNPESMKLNVTGSMGAYFANGSGKDFKVSLYSKDGYLIKTETYDNSNQTQNLYNDFNNLGFSYGDIIKVSSLGVGQATVSNYNGENSYLVNKSVQMTITQNGLEPCNLPEVNVNPFDVLGNGKVTTGVLTGTIKNPNQVINIIVNGKTITTKSDSKGNFKVNISDPNGFTASTNIIVETEGEIAKKINPTVDSKLGILNSNITISDKDQDGTFGQMIKFNAANMTISNTGSNFAAQLISGKTGQVLASCSTSNFNVFTSKNNLNGAHFEYGDIIAVYESQETELSMGELLLDSGKSKIDCTNKFKCFKITPNGLVPVANENLTTSQILYKGISNMDLTGKTLPNTDVTITYGNVSKVVKSNSNGDFSLEIPVSEAPIGSEVRIFVNNDNNENLVVRYDSKVININSNRIEIVNNTNVPIFNINFDAVDNKLKAVEYPLGKPYTGAFYGNDLNINLINPKDGKVIYSFNGNKLNDINSFISEINNKSYNLGDVIEISYNPSLIKANVYDGKKNIGNTNGAKEYFEITNKGLINLNDKFINVKPLDILGSTKVTSTNIEGKANPNTSVEVSVDGNVFKGTTDGNGEFNIPISDKNGFTSNTNIVISSEGYIPTTINPTMESNIQLMNSYINFYNNSGWQGELSSSIAFNPETMKFVVNNYTNSFGKGNSHYFNLDLYNNNGTKLLDASINNGSTSQLTEALNGKSFNYGDIIGLSYNNTVSKPVVLNGNQVLGNISGNEEYFKITKDGLMPVKFGQNSYTNNISWDNNNLVIDSNLADGQSEDILNANKKLVILNSNNQIIDSVNTSVLNNNSASVQGIIPQAVLDKLNKGETYTFALDINNQLFPMKVESNTPSNSKYVLEANSDNTLSIIAATTPVVTINSANDIVNYMNTLTSDINTAMSKNINIANVSSNSKLGYEIATRAFISRIGAENLENFFNKSEENRDFINWVLNNETAIEEYLDATSQLGINMNGLQIWSDIWNTYTNSRAGFNLKLAIAVAVSNANPISAWPCKGTVGSPVERYNIFETLNAEGGMLPIFRTLDVRHIMYVVNTHIPNSQILEMRAIIMQNHNGFINASGNGLNNIAYTIEYNEINPHTGASVFGPDFYGPNPNILDVWYDGGVCGSTSYLGSSACQVFGIPAQPVGQPGHCAFIFYNNEHKWNIGNNIFGWSQSSGADISGWSNGIATNGNVTNYDLLYENINPETLKKSNEYLWLANSESSYQDKMNAINEALKIEPLNVRAWLDKIALMKTNHNLTVQDYINLSDQIISALKDYPMPMVDVLLQIKNIILSNGNQQDYKNYIKAIDNALNSVTNVDQKPTAKEMIQSMPENGLVDGETPLENSKININNVWSQGLGTIGFDPVNMKMTVNKGWSEVNPYLSGEAFSIGLYNKDNQLIKSLTLKGGEYPENDLYNAFNNLGFKYGDKIYIDYKTSSKISASQVYKNGALENSYNVNKSSVFELTSRGLVYLGDSLQNSSENATLNVSTVYPDGKIVTGDKYNYKETGLIGDPIESESIPTLENYHIDYVTVNGVKTNTNQLPKYYLGNNMNIVYHMASDNEYKLNIDVKTEDGKVLSTMPVASYAKGDKISISDNNWDKKEYKLDYILVDGVKTPADKLPTVMPDNNLNITYVVSPIAKSTITVETMVNGKVLGKPVITTNYEGEAYKEVAPVWDNNDYELKDITVNGVKTSTENLPKVFGDKNTTIIYNLVPKIMTVGERVVNEKGKVLYQNEYKLPFDASVTNIEDKIPSNYKLKDITISSNNSEGNNINLKVNTKTYTNINDVKVISNGEMVTYNVVPIEGEISYETQIGNEKPVDVGIKSGQIETEVGTYNIKVPKGYEVKSITINGQDVNSLDKLTYKKEKQVVVYHLVKIPTNSVTESIITNTGKVLMPVKVVKTGEEGESVDIKGLSIPKGYKLEKVTIDGKEVKAANDYEVKIGDKTTSIVYTVIPIENNTISEEMISTTGTVIVPTKVVAKGIDGDKVELKRLSIPANYHLVKVLLNNEPISSELNNKVIYVLPSEISNKNEKITYVVAENESKYKVEVVCGSTPVRTTTTEGYIGEKPSNLVPSIPKGYMISSITVNGQKATESDIPKEYGSKNIEVIYHITKIPTGEILEKVVTNTGKVIVKEHEVASGEVGKAVNLQVYKPEEGYTIKSVIINGKTYSAENIEKELPKDIENGDISITYIVEANSKSTQSKNSQGKHKQKASENHNGETKNTANSGSKVTNGTENSGSKQENHNGKVNNTGDNGSKVTKGTENSGSKQENHNGKANNTGDNGSKVTNGTGNSGSKQENHNGTTKNTNEPDQGNTSHVTNKIVEKGEVIIKVVNQNGKVIEEATHVGNVGFEFNPINIPNKDKVISVTLNGKEVSTNTIINKIEANKETNNKTTVIYNVDVPENVVKNQNPKPVAIGKVIIKVVNQDGKVIESAIHEGDIGSKFNEISIPKNDKIVSVTVNGVESNKVPNSIEANSNNNTTTIIYNVEVPKQKITNQTTGNVNGNTNKTSGHTNKSNSGDNQENHSVNNKISGQGANKNQDTNKNNEVKNGDLKIEVVNENGKVIYYSNVNEKIGSKIGKVNIPKGYHLDNVTVTINGENSNEIPSKVTEGNTTIIYHVSKDNNNNNTPKTSKVTNGTLKVEIVSNNGKVLYESSSNEPIGSKISILKMPKGYKLENITSDVNGSKLNGIPTNVVKGETVVVYHVVSINNNEAPKNNVTNNNSGSKGDSTSGNGSKVTNGTGNSGNEQGSNSGKANSTSNSGSKVTNGTGNSGNEQGNNSGKANSTSNSGSKVTDGTGNSGNEQGNNSGKANSTSNSGSKVTDGTGNSGNEQGSNSGKANGTSNSGSKVTNGTGNSGNEQGSNSGKANSTSNSGSKVTNGTGNSGNEQGNNSGKANSTSNSGSKVTDGTGNSGNEQGSNSGKANSTSNNGSKVTNGTGSSGTVKENHNGKAKTINIGSINNNSNTSTGLEGNNQGIPSGNNINSIGNIGQIKNNQSIADNTNNENNRVFNSGSVSDGLSNGGSYTDNNLIHGQNNQNNNNSSISESLPDTGLNMKNKENKAKDLGALAALIGAMSALFIFRRKK